MKKTIFFILAVLSLLLAGCGNQTATPQASIPQPADTVVAEGHVTPTDDLKLSFSVRGKVAEILAAEGQQVKKGDVLVRLADREQAQAALAAAQLELTSSQQAYDDFIRKSSLAAAQAWDVYQKAQAARSDAQLAWEKIDPNDIKDRIDEAQTDVSDKKKAMEDAQDELDKYKDLKDDNPTRRDAEKSLRDAEAAYNEALRNVEKIQREADAPRALLDAAIADETEAKRIFDNTLNNAPDPEKKALLEARLNNAKAQVASAQNTLDNYDLKAPFDGTVTDVNVTVGELIGSEKFAIQMANLSIFYIETSDLTELEVVNVTLGQSVAIVPDALPDLTLNGTVESISQSSKTQGGDVLYTVKIKLNDTDPRLRWGMTVETTFQTAK